MASERFTLTDARGIPARASSPSVDRASSRVLRLKIAGHKALDLFQGVAASLARSLPGSWKLLGLPKGRVRSLPQSIAAARESLDWMARCKGPYCEIIHQPLAMSRRAPRCAVNDVIHRQFTVERYHVHNELFLARLPGAHIVGPNGVVITANGNAVEESTWGRGWLEKDRVFKSCKLPRASTLSGHSYTIACLSSEGYAHWLLDSLPRLFAIDRTPVDELNLIVSRPLNRWQEQSLAMLGMDNLKVIALENRRLEVEALYLPSFAGSTGNPHPYGCQWMRERLLKDSTKRRRLYVTRRRAERRRIVNEHQLEPILADNGFEIVEAESLSFEEQVEMFGEAEAIVGPHGAGLTNILFAPAGCKVLEIFDPNHVKVMYYALADVLKQPYWYLVGDQPNSTAVQHGVSGHDDIYISASGFARSLNAMFKDVSEM